MTPAAQAALRFARAEAAALNQHYLGTEHILLGVIREANSDAAQVVASRSDLDSVRARVGQMVGVGSDAPAGEFPSTARAADVLHFARREADLYGETHVAPEHLLLGILREGAGIAAQVLISLDIDLGALRAEVARSLPAKGDG